MAAGLARAGTDTVWRVPGSVPRHRADTAAEAGWMPVPVAGESAW